MATGEVTSADQGRSATRELRVALALMRLALPLLNRAGETLTAARLQHAIDATERDC